MSFQIIKRQRREDPIVLVKYDKISSANERSAELMKCRELYLELHRTLHILETMEYSQLLWSIVVRVIHRIFVWLFFIFALVVFIGVAIQKPTVDLPVWLNKDVADEILAMVDWQRHEHLKDNIRVTS